MSFHHYPIEVQRSDLIRGGSGLLLTGVPLIFLPMHWIVTVLFTLAAVLFAVFTARIVQRLFTRYETGDQGIVAHGPLGGAVTWDELSALNLKFYSTRRDRKDGWMLLVLGDGKRTLKLESTLTGFDEIVDQAAEVAKTKRLPLTEATTSNLLAMGAPVVDDLPEGSPEESAQGSAQGSDLPPMAPSGGRDRPAGGDGP